MTTRLDLGSLDRGSLDAVAALCERGAAWPPSRDELADALFSDDQPVGLLGDPEVGVVATVRAKGDPSHGHIRLLVVDPAHRGTGVGRRLLAAAEAELADCRSIVWGADGPWYLYPGIPAESTALCVLAERGGYRRAEANFNMDLPLADLDLDPTGARRGGPDDRDSVEAWAAAHWMWWADELVRAAERSVLAIVEDPDDEHGIAALGAWDVTRRGVLGPFCVRPDLMGTGRGAPTIDLALVACRDSGLDRVEVGWVGPLNPYARCGATIGRTFHVYRKDLRR